MNPTKIFDRAQDLANTQIISYKVEDSEKWCALIGIGPGSAERCVGVLPWGRWKFVLQTKSGEGIHAALLC